MLGMRRQKSQRRTPRRVTKEVGSNREITCNPACNPGNGFLKMWRGPQCWILSKEQIKSVQKWKHWIRSFREPVTHLGAFSFFKKKIYEKEIVGGEGLWERERENLK